MKHLFIILFSIVLFSCKKEENAATNMTFQFVSTDTTFNANIGTSVNNLKTSILFQNGNAEDITLTTSSLPTGVSFNPALPKTYSASLFTLNTATAITLPVLTVANTTPTGTYPITITATATSGHTSTFTINLVVDRAQFAFVSSDTTININSGTSINNLSTFIRFNNGNSEDITITSSTLPTGVSFNPALPKTYSASLFTLNTATSITLPVLTVSNTTPTGTYPITITATATSGHTSTFTINLVVRNCVTQTENSSQGTYKGSWNILSIPALADTITILNIFNIPDQKVLLSTKALSPLVFVATLSGNNFTIADISLPSLPIGPVTLTNVTINGSGSFDCTGKIISLTMRFVSGNIVVGSIPLNIAGQSFSGNFTR